MVDKAEVVGCPAYWSWLVVGRVWLIPTKTPKWAQKWEGGSRLAAMVVAMKVEGPETR
jgi:hypothetical protein